MRRALIITGFSLLAVVALTGWTRKMSVAPAVLSPAAAWQQAPGAGYAAAYPATPVVYAPQPGFYAPAMYGYYPAAPAPYGAAPVMYAPAAPQASYSYYRQPETRVVTRPVVERRYVPVRTVKRPRSTGKSVAIVAGSAGAGAAIGALAGGGKGAGIGALSGGLAGFVYDRLTRNR